MFGRTRRNQDPTSKRDRLSVAVKEVMASQATVVLWVKNLKIVGAQGICQITDEKGSHFNSPDAVMQVVANLDRLLPDQCVVVGRLTLTVSVPSIGHVIDLAQGRANPRYHAVNLSTITVALKSTQDLQGIKQQYSSIKLIGARIDISQ